jgi:hypothetical protein
MCRLFYLTVTLCCVGISLGQRDLTQLHDRQDQAANDAHDRFLPVETTIPVTPIPSTEATTAAVGGHGVSDTDVTTVVPPAPAPANYTPPKWPSDVPTGHWNVTEFGKTRPCFMAKFGLVLVVPYRTTTGMVFNGTVAVPSNATMNGTCNSMALTWPAGYGAAFTNVNRLSMTFDRAYDASKNESYYRPATMTAALVFDPVHFPGAADAGPVQMTVDHPWFFMSAPFNKSYSCNADWYVMANRTTPMVDLPGRNVTGMFMFKDLQIQPYMTEASNGRFDTSIGCSADSWTGGGGRSSHVVPIAVGCTLLGLVIIAMLAYFGGRRRRRRGYGTP